MWWGLKREARGCPGIGRVVLALVRLERNVSCGDTVSDQLRRMEEGEK